MKSRREAKVNYKITYQPPPKHIEPHDTLISSPEAKHREEVRFESEINSTSYITKTTQ